MLSLYLLITILLVASSINSLHAFNYDFSKQIPFPLQSAPSSCSPSTNLPPNIFTHLAQYSPWFPADRYSPPPQGCTIDQVNILHRHSSRFPTAGAGRIIKSCINRLQTAVHRRGRQSSLSWLLNYRYELGSEDLVELGIQEAQDSARCIYKRYSRLAEMKGIFIRSSSSPRVVHTANIWTKEFEKASSDVLHIKPPLVISDAATSNDTLANAGCPLHAALHTHWQWASEFTAPIARRLQREVAGYTVTAHDVIVLMSLCAFQSVADNAMSKSCSLFTEDEFRKYEYFNDLEKYYNTGYGNPLGPVQGVGYIAELLARLTSRQVEDCTQTNSTLDGDEATFPHSKGIYVDFSHDNTMAAIVSAMGLFGNDSQDLPLDHINESRAWKFGHIAPFAGRLAVERLDCGEHGKRVRVVANEALVGIPFCKSDTYGTCGLDDFVESQRFARVDGQEKWKECFEGER